MYILCQTVWWSPLYCWKIQVQGKQNALQKHVARDEKLVHMKVVLGTI